MKIRQWLSTILLITVLLVTCVVANAEDVSAPLISVVNVEAGKSTTILCEDFPAEKDFVIQMSSANAADFSDVVKFNSQKGGSFHITFAIPQQFATVEMLDGKAVSDDISVPFSLINKSADQIAMEANQPAGFFYYGYPTISIKEVDPGNSITVEGYNFPPMVHFDIKMGPTTCYPNVGTYVMSYDSKDGGNMELVIPIPDALKNLSPLTIRFDSRERFNAYNWFTNQKPVIIETPVVTETSDESAVVEAVPEESSTETTVDEIAVPAETTAQCDYSVLPSFIISKVVKDDHITIQTKDFPSNGNFAVFMGHFVSASAAKPDFPSFEDNTWQDVHVNNLYPVHPQPILENWGHGPQKPEKSTAPAVEGEEIGTIHVDESESMTLSFEIPEALQGNSQIAIWIADTGDCGFYAYNYFWNTNSEVEEVQATEDVAENDDSAAIETVEIEPIEEIAE